MILIVCVDNKNGMCFNGRRQSKDKVLRARILEKTANARLWMNPYSAKQFGPEAGPQVQVSEEFLSQAGQGEYCFAENLDPASCSPLPEQVIRYCWNRDYPADLWCTLDLSLYKLTHTEEFAGSSHETITEEVYSL